MKYPNALAGVKKLYTAEILALIGAVFGLITALAAFAGIGSGSIESISVTLLAITGAMAIVMLVLLLISFIMSIVGLNTAKPDEENFKNALIYTFVCIAASVVQGCVKDGTLLDEICKTLVSAGSIVINWYVCTAIINLANNLNDSAMATKGAAVRKLLVIVWGAGLVLNLVGDFLGGKEGVTTFAVIALVLAAAAAVTEVVAYFLYLKLLGNARKMLEA